MEIGTVRPVPIDQELSRSYLDYAMSVIVARALPDVRDGLKPVQRRILYAMEGIGLRPNTPFKKSARIVGEVLGKYHPHGDAPVYEAMVRLAQDFTLRYPLVEGQGNFGSIDNDPPAAMRYTEARLHALAMEILQDLDKETVDFSPNFDASLSEPTVLPTVLPNLLVNGSSGIAVGMATNIPPHNLREVCDALVHLIDNPDCSTEELLTIIRGPDFPTGGFIAGEAGLREAYLTGKGRIVLKGKVEVEEAGRGRQQVLITQLPYQTNKAALVERVADLVKERRLEGVLEVRDESDRHGIRVVVELKKDADTQVVIRNLFRLTPLRTGYFLTLLALVDGEPRILTLKEFLEQHIRFRQEVIARRSRYELRQAQQRAHILEGLRLALKHLDEVIRTIRRSASAEAAREELMNRFQLSQPQAQAILDMPLRRLAALERQRIDEEYAELVRQIGYLEDLLASPRRVLSLIQEEARQLKAHYGDPRRTQLGEEEPELSEEEYIHSELAVVTLGSRYTKRVSLDGFRSQQRGGKGVSGTAGDEGRFLLVADTLDRLLFFTSAGRAYSLKVHQISSESSRTSRGAPLSNALPFFPREVATAVLPLSNGLEKADSLFLATRKGQGKRLALDPFTRLRKPGLRAMRLRAGDEVIAALPVGTGAEVVLVSARGRALRLATEQFRMAGRGAGGIRAFRLEEGDSVVGVVPVLPGAELLLVTTRGYGKRLFLTSIPRHGRGTKGVMASRISEKTGPVVAAGAVLLQQEVLFMTARGQVERTPVKDISHQGRATRGVILMVPDADDRVVTFAAFQRR